MQPYADYTYYTQEYGGSSIPSDQWKLAANRASAVIDYVTMSQVKKLDTVPEAVKNACCGIADLMHMDTQSAGKSSETVGKHSVSYTTKDETAQIKSYFSAARMYLADTGLLYRGTRA